MLLTKNDVENHIISIILAEKMYHDCIFSQLKPKHFLTAKARTIFTIAEKQYYTEGYTDNVFVTQQLKSENKLFTEINKYITATTLSYISGANYQFYINKLKQNYISSLVDKAKNEEDFINIKEEIEQAQGITKIDHISAGADEFLTDYYEQYDKNIEFHWESVGKAIGNLCGGDYFFLSALTGGGKSAFALNLAYETAKKGKKVLYINLEMTTQQMQNRLVGRIAQINTGKYRAKKFTPDELIQYSYVLKELNNLPLYVASPLNCTPQEIKNLISQNNSDLVIIDYLGLMSTGKETKGDTERIGYLSRKIKNMALFFNIPFIILHQLNRDYKDRKDKRPLLTDIKNSSQIEQDSDFVTFLHSPLLFDKNESHPELLEFIVAKNRHGPVNTIINLRFIKEYQYIKEF